ncbi:hypothetical protein [Povalibacter sp.]|uniref:hypothetical protein n=1 Tax=Povalibacter sp. TaxID=1962978 RepID=UPI002F42EAB9
MVDSSPLQQQADLIRASGALGKPGALSRLFDFLLERSLAGEAPKELEIAFKVFGKDSRFDVSQDSVVRVYVHKLRRRLDDYYAGLGTTPQRLTIPKGEYRLTIEEQPGAMADAVSLPVSPPAIVRPRRIWPAVLALLAAVAVGSLVTFALMRSDGSDERFNAVRASAIWAPLLDDDLPITIVVGDYYMMGETDESGHIRRLVREFFINSTGDFVHQVEVSPKVMERYRNLNLTYLPTSTAFALQDIVPVLAARKNVRVMLMSDLSGSMLTTSHIVYVGFLSGLGILGDPTFAASRIALGGTYDELIDLQTDARYRSTGGDTTESRYVDYGFVSAFPGPGTNRVVIIAGARDTGVMQAAAAISSASGLAQVQTGASSAAAFEMLYEVQGVARAGMSSKLLFVSPMEPKRIWEMER